MSRKVMSLKNLVRPEIHNLPIINIPESIPSTIRLNANEVPTSPWTSLENYVPNRYPPVRPDSLIKPISNLFEVEEDQLLISRGSTEAIDIIIRTFCNPNKDEIMICPPTFDMYEFFAMSNSIQTHEISLKKAENFKVDIQRLIESMQGSTKIIFLASPNNPTGNSLTKDEIILLLEEVNNRAIVVIDEAYIEFSPIDSIASEIENYNNLIILRTLSKAFSLAGLRCGAMIASSDCINFLKRIISPFCFATPVINLIKQAIESNNSNDAKKQIQFIATERKRIMKDLIEISCVKNVWQSDGNFLLTEFKDLDKTSTLLQKAGIIIGCPKHKELENCARVTISNEQQNNKFLEELKKLT